jgi:putative redox protein
MGAEIDITYEGDLHCRAVHGPSGAVIQTDAPTDNQGRGEAFSPTDMLATSLGVCMMTVMGIFARRHEIDLKGSKVHVTKEMVADPDRRVSRLTVTIDLPASVPQEWRAALEKAGMTCPVHKSLPDSVERPVTFRYSL